MFTLDVNMPKMNSMLFTHGKGAGDIGILHKRVGHVNLQHLKLMEKQNLVGGLPNLEQNKHCQKFVKHANWGSKLGIHSQLKQLM
jgi:hypothetical protein